MKDLTLKNAASSLLIAGLVGGMMSLRLPKPAGQDKAAAEGINFWSSG